jgi:anti-sigma regulatory factor (Ser/Thr protein kinase)
MIVQEYYMKNIFTRMRGSSPRLSAGFSGVRSRRPSIMSNRTMIHLDLPATQKHVNILDVCITEVLDQVNELSDPGITINDIRLAVQEAWNNIVEYAYQGDANGRVDISLFLDETAHHLIIEMHDSGCSFDFDIANVSGLDAEDIRGDHLGLFLLYMLMDEVTYVPRPGKNFWRLLKHLA